jgi:hypothetical protein
MLAMIGSGALNVAALRTRKFPLDHVNEAVPWAAKGPGGLEHAALVP